MGRSRNGGQEKTIEAIRALMHIHWMAVVGDDNHFGGIAFEPAREDEAGLETAKGRSDESPRRS